MHAGKHGEAPRVHTRDVVIRNATGADYEDLVDLWRELMAHHVRLDTRFTLATDADDRFLSYLDTATGRDDYRVRLATVGERAVGFVVACVLPNSPVYRARYVGYINDLCVTQGARGQGIGTHLVEDAVRWLRQEGADTVEVYVAHENRDARRFWRRVGGRAYLERLALDLSQFEPSR